MRWTLIFSVLCFALGACTGDGLRPVAVELSAVEPADAVLWLDAAEPQFLEVEVSNPSRVGLLVEARGRCDQVAVESQEFSLEAGVTKTVQLRVEPLAEGAFELPVSLTAEGETAAVTLHGRVARAPACSPAAPCRTESFSVAAGRCVTSFAADGASCEDACVIGQCAQGECRGTALTCPDDGDPCTVPVCSSEDGCGVVPRACTSNSPCLTSRCEPGVGCIEEPVTDGTSCGEPNCDQDFVCMEGACVQRAPPDGVAVARCLKATAVHTPAYEGVSCAVEPDGFGVCWGAVLSAFTSPLPWHAEPQWTGPWVARTDRPIKRWLGRGNPMCSQTEDGRVYCMSDGSNSAFWNTDEVGFFEVERLRDAVDLLRFASVMCRLSQEGAVNCWGEDPPGFKMSAPYGTAGSFPYLMPGPSYSGETIVPPELGAVRLAGGPNPEWPCFVASDGQVFCRDPYERAIFRGCGSMLAADTFEPFPGWPAMVQFSASPHHACGVAADGRVHCAGANTVHQLGRAGYEYGQHYETGVRCEPPGPVPWVTTASKVLTGFWNSCALGTDGVVTCWGQGVFTSQRFPAPEDPLQPPENTSELRLIRDFDLSAWRRNDYEHDNPRSSYFLLRSVLCALDFHGRVKCGGGAKTGANGLFLEGNPRDRPSLERPRAVVLPAESITIQLRDSPEAP